MDNVSQNLPLQDSDEQAEQAAKALYARLEKMTQRAREGTLTNRKFVSFRKHLIKGMAKIGYVDMVAHIEEFMRDAGHSMEGPAPDMRFTKLVERTTRDFEEAHWKESPEEELYTGLCLVWSILALLLAQGHDVRGAFVEMARASDGTSVQPNGTIAKPDGWREPNLAEFVGF